MTSSFTSYSARSVLLGAGLMAFLVGLAIAPAFAETSSQSHAVTLDIADGQALALGPVYVAEIFEPEHPGTAVITLHPDTDFDVLKHVKIGDRIKVGAGALDSVFTISEIRIADEGAENMYDITDSPAADMAVITCYPEEAGVGMSIRYMVFSDAIDEA